MERMGYRGPAAPLSRRAFVGGAAGAMLAALSGCASPAQDDAGEGEVATALTMSIAEPATLDPGAATDAASLQAVYQLFEPLTGYDAATGELVGRAARSWEASDDALTFTFHLRDATFHDGAPVTAADFKRAWERIVNPGSALSGVRGGVTSDHAFRLALVAGYDELAAGTASGLAGVTCPDDLTLQVALSQPYAELPAVLSHPALAPVPAAAEEDAAGFARHPVGNGPYAMTGTWEQAAPAIHLAAYAGYRAGAPVIENLRLIFPKDTQSGYTDFLTGSVDVCACPIEEASSAASRHGRSSDGMTMGSDGHLVEGTTLTCGYLACNLDDPVLAHLELRNALSLAIDRTDLCDTVLCGVGEPADGIVPPHMPGYREGAWACAIYDPQDAAARFDALVTASAAAAADAEEAAAVDGAGQGAEAGAATAAVAAEAVAPLPDQISLSIIYYADGGHDDELEAVADDWSSLGLTCELEPLAYDEFERRIAAGEFQLARLDVACDYPALDAVLYPLFHSASIGGRNVSRYRNAGVDALIDEARATTDEATRIARLQQADAVVSGEMPVIPLVFSEQAFVGADAVEGLVIDPLGYAHVGAATLAG